MTRAVLSALVLLLTGLGAGGARAEPARALPQHLRDTGLFVEGSMTDVRPDVMAFSGIPSYKIERTARRVRPYSGSLTRVSIRLRLSPRSGRHRA